jgi:hypothetical protein
MMSPEGASGAIAGGVNPREGMALNTDRAEEYIPGGA